MSVKKQRTIQIPFGIVHHLDVKNHNLSAGVAVIVSQRKYVIDVSFEELETQPGVSCNIWFNVFKQEMLDAPLSVTFR